MNRASRSCVRSLIDSHFAGSISAAREGVMRGHLPDCERCRRYYNGRLLLAKLEPGAAAAEERIAVGLGLRTRRQAQAGWSLAFALCAAVVLLTFVPLSSKRTEFASRGAVDGATPAFFVYRIDPARKLDPGSIIQATDDLAFAYTNPSGFRRLLVFGVDEHRHVYWYYPAWSNPADEPHAIAVLRGPEVRELPEAVRHDLDGQKLTIHAIFLDDDASVRDVEQRVTEAQAADLPLAMPGAYEQRLILTVGR